MIRTVFTQIALFLTALFLAGTLVLPFNGGYVLAYVLMGLTVLLVGALLAARARWTIGPAGWCLIGAFLLIAIAFTIDRDAKLMVNYVFLLAIVPLSSWFSRYAAPDSAAVVSWVALVGTLLSAVTALWEIYLGNTRAEGWWSDPIWAAEAALVLGFLSLMGLPVLRSRWRFALLLGPALGVGIVALSGSRGPLVAAPVMALALMFTTFRPWWKQILALGVVVVVAGALILPFAPKVLERIERTGTVIVQLVTKGKVKENSAGARIAFWKAGVQAFAKKPLTGYGWTRHVKAAYKFLPDKGKKYNSKGNGLEGNRHLHADILDLGVSAGVMGIGAYALMILAPLLGAIRSVRDGQYSARLTGAIVLSVGYLMCGLTYLTIGLEFHRTLYVCLTAVVLGFCRDAPPGRPAAAVSPAG